MSTDTRTATATQTDHGKYTVAVGHTWKIGDVMEDHYGNPAIVLGIGANGNPSIIMQLVGSDRGRIRGASTIRRTYSNAEYVAGVQEWGREVWRERGYKRSQFGLR